MISRQILSHDSSTEDTSSSSSTTSSSSISTTTDNFIEGNFNNPCPDPFNFTMQPEQLSFVVEQPTVEPEPNQEDTISTLLDELFIVLYDPVEIAKMSSKLQFRHYRPQLPMRERQLPKSFFNPPNSYSRNLPENAYSASQIVVKNYPHTSQSSHSNTLNHLNSSRDPHDSYHCYQSSKSELIPAISHQSSVNNVPKKSNNSNIMISNHNRHISSYIEGQYDRMFASIEVTSTTLKYQKALPIAPSFESSLAPLSSTSLGPHFHHQSTGNSGFDIELLQPTSNSATCSNNSSSSNDDQLSVADCSIVGHQKQRRISNENKNSNQFHQNPDSQSNSWINYFNTIANSNSKSIYVGPGPCPGSGSGPGNGGIIGLEHQSKNFTIKSISENADIVETQSNDNLTNQTNSADYLDLDGIDHADFAHSNLEFASAYQPPVQSSRDHSHLPLPYESNSNPSPEIVSVNIYRPIGADFHPYSHHNHHQLSSYSNRSIQQPQQQHLQSDEHSTNAVTQSMPQSSTIGPQWNSCWN